MSDDNKKIIYSVDEEYDSLRLDLFLSGMQEELSRSYISKLIDQGLVSVNGKDVSKSSVKVKEGDEVILLLPPSVVPDIKPEDIPLDILYEDNDVIVVNKPKGMVVHPAAGHYEGTLVNALLYHCKDLSGINGVMRPGIVHRIDKDTSGSLVICKNDIAHHAVADQLKIHSINRIYYAIIHGHPSMPEGTIHKPIGRDPSNRLKMAVCEEGKGKDAITHYEVVEELNGYSLIKCKLETGRTHQIRVHMSSIHHPILGDPLYETGFSNPFEHLQGQCLHAATIGLNHPKTGEYLEVTAPMPEYFAHLLDILRNK
jgi:23S rRNA pseudouridine1911/1915/1917 synthase